MLKDLKVDELCCGSLQEAFRSPREIGCYSVDVNKTVRCDRSQMKYYRSREDKDLPLDLNVRYEDTLREDYNRLEKFYQFLKVILDSHFDVLDRVDFVTTRGTVQQLLCTPFSTANWMICASRVDDVIYFALVDRDEAIEEKANATEREKLFCAWGFRFEAYMTADQPKGIPDSLSITHEVEKFETIFTNKIGKYDLLMKAEIDGILPSRASRLREGDTSCYIELKTSKCIPNFRSKFIFKKSKSLQWWSQSIIVGIEDTFCGMRDDEGFVRAIFNFKTKELPFMCQNFWNPTVSFNFCNNFLKYLTGIVKDNRRIVYKFEYVGESRIFLSKFRDPPEKLRVLPEWYMAGLEKHKRRNQV